MEHSSGVSVKEVLQEPTPDDCATGAGPSSRHQPAGKLAKSYEPRKNPIESTKESVVANFMIGHEQEAYRLLQELGRMTIPGFPECCTEAIHIVAWHGLIDVLPILLNKGPGLDARDGFSWTPLHAAAYSGQLDFVCHMLRFYTGHFAVDSPDEAGCTPLMAAARQGHKHIINVLLQNGADLLRADLAGRYSWDYARDGGHITLVDYLVNTARSLGHTSVSRPKSPAEGDVNVNPDLQGASTRANAELEVSPVESNEAHAAADEAYQEQFYIRPMNEGFSNAAIKTAVYRKDKEHHREETEAPFNDVPMPAKPVFLSLVSVAQLVLLIVILNNGGIVSLKENHALGPSLRDVYMYGARETEKIYEGQWWRWFTAMFVHSGIFHMAGILFGQWYVCQHLERKYGTFSVGLVYIGGGITGTLFSALFQPSEVSYGSSGAMFATLALIAADLIKNWDVIVQPGRILAVYVLSVGFCFAVGLLPLVDNFAHLGGFIGGFFISLAVVLDIPRNNRHLRKLARLLGLACYSATLALAFVWLYSERDRPLCGPCRFLNCIPIRGWCDSDSSDSFPA